MKWIKTYEKMGRPKKQIKEIDFSKELEEYKDQCEQIDLGSSITFDRFFDNLDFSAFSNCPSKFSNTGILPYGQHEFKVLIKDGSEVVSIYNYPNEYCRKNGSNLSSLMEWKKRNCFLYAEVNTGGYSGGSCWDEGDDPGAQPYEGESLDLHDFVYQYLKPILENILYEYHHDKSVDELCEILYSSSYNIIGEDSRYNNEYYGNGDDYACHTITLGDLFKFLLENGCF